MIFIIMSKVFISFAGGNQYGDRLYDALNRITDQATKIGVFDKVIGYTDSSLKNDKEFWDLHGEFLTKMTKGYGYWLWKPYIVKKTIETMKDGDVLLYLDAGCEMNISKPDDMNRLIGLAMKHDMVYTGSGMPTSRNTKKDVMIEMGMYDEKSCRAVQNQAGVVFYHVNERTRKFANEWYNICSDKTDNYRMINECGWIKNIPSIEGVHRFDAHRHDQSIFSLLAYKYNIGHRINAQGIPSIRVERNRSGISKINN